MHRGVCLHLNVNVASGFQGGAIPHTHPERILNYR